jgi:hypothetical protein
MGQAKRNRARLMASPCRCQSSKPASECCFDGRQWHKTPATLGLRSLPQNSAVDRCYMKELGSCAGGISGEHLISKSIIEFLKLDGDFAISGLPWLEEGESKILSSRNLTANSLCSKHNSALSPLDSAALSFFTALRACWVNEGMPLHYLVSGHDLERWLLKSLKVMAVSRNLARERTRLAGVFQEEVRLIDMLDDPSLWPKQTGLYFLMKPGERTHNYNHFQLSPLYGLANDIIAGLTANILGLSLLMMVEPPDMAKSPSLRMAQSRPGCIAITVGTTINKIDLSWEDGIRHDPVGLTFLGKV